MKSRLLAVYGFMEDADSLFWRRFESVDRRVGDRLAVAAMYRYGGHDKRVNPWSVRTSKTRLLPLFLLFLSTPDVCITHNGSAR